MRGIPNYRKKLYMKLDDVSGGTFVRWPLRGIQPCNHILQRSYDELETQLLDSFPESVTSRLYAEPP
jgi:hypothetical protein